MTKERSRTSKKNQTKQTPPHKHKPAKLSKTDHGEKVKQAQALTAIYTSPALTSSSAGNSQGPMNEETATCKQGYLRFASSFSFCKLTHLADFQGTVPI